MTLGVFFHSSFSCEYTGMWYTHTHTSRDSTFPAEPIKDSFPGNDLQWLAFGFSGISICFPNCHRFSNCYQWSVVDIYLGLSFLVLSPNWKQSVCLVLRGTRLVPLIQHLQQIGITRIYLGFLKTGLGSVLSRMEMISWESSAVRLPQQMEKQ